jgi:hypothetical protein
VAAATDVAMWDACGGMSSYGQNASDPSVACPAGSYCNFYNEWFWQCQPDASDVSEAATQTETYPVPCAVSTATLGMSMHRCMCCCGLSRSERWMDVPWFVPVSVASADRYARLSRGGAQHCPVRPKISVALKHTSIALWHPVRRCGATLASRT